MHAATDFQQTFTDFDLRNFFYSSSLGRYDLTGFKPREAWILQTLLTLYAAGAASLRCHRSVLAELCERIAGFGYSIRTLSTALADAERLGFIERRTYRHGGELRIILCDTLADLLSRDKLKRCDKKPHGKEFPTGEKDRSSSPVPSGSFSFNCEIPARVDIDINESDRAAAEQAEQTHKKKPKPVKPGKGNREEWHPVARTVWYVTQNFALVSLAMNEIKHGGRSGVDWDHWCSHWDMCNDARESIARREIIPHLERFLKFGKNELGNQNPIDPQVVRVYDDREPAETAYFSPAAAGAGAKVDPAAATPPTDPEMRALWEAAERAKKRAADLNQWEYQAALASLQADLS